MPQLNPGDNAPELSLPNQLGIDVSLEDFRGHHLVLWWYPKADTPG